MPISPWANKSVAPMQAAGPLIPWTGDGKSARYRSDNHGTAFFITEDGFFLTAAHLVRDLRPIVPQVEIMIVSAFGMATLPVEWVKCHATADVALGRALVDPNHPTKVRPLTLSSRRLEAGEDVAVLGAPHNETDTRVGADGETWQRFTFHGPDYFEGEVLEYHPDGVCLSPRGFPVYSTSIAAPPVFPDLGGASGGPLVASGSVEVHGILCSSSEGYSICTDIGPILDWEVFDPGGIRTLRVMAERLPHVLNVR
jgi:hypothetical protein